MPIAAVIQMTSTIDVAQNIETAILFIKQAAKEGACLAVLPEDFALLAKHEAQRLSIKEAIDDGPIQSAISTAAKQNKIWVVAGTIPLQCDDPQKIRSTMLVYNAQGERVARYDKIHLFDVRVDDNKRQYCESKITQAGDKIEVIDSPLGRLGLCVCYDLRFPELFRKMHKQNVQVFVLPAAFTAVTGRQHWEVLLRARAIENLSYILAAAQWGIHDNGRETYGDSLIVEPWGDIIARKSTEVGVTFANIDLERLQSLRDQFPALSHQKL